MKVNSSVPDNDKEKQKQQNLASGSMEAKILSVEMSTIHRRHKEIWRADLRYFQTEKEDAMDELRRLWEEMYQIVSMSLIFEGVVFTAVAQATRLTCSLSWSPVVLAVAVAAAASIAVFDKYRAIYDTEHDQDSAKGNITGLMKSLELLDREGSALDLDKATPENSCEKKKSGLCLILFVAKRASLTVALVVIFSLIVSLFSKITLCRDCKPCPAP